MKTNLDFARQAVNGQYIGIPYTTLDCQGFVKKVLYDCGARTSSGGRYTWKGSNHMWRKALSWKGTYAEALAKYGQIPKGALLFTVKNDGGQKQRGYNDNEGNASHVGIFVGDLGVKASIHSTTGGVQWGDVPAKRWTHVGLFACLDYETKSNVCPTCGREL